MPPALGAVALRSEPGPTHSLGPSSPIRRSTGQKCSKTSALQGGVDRRPDADCADYADCAEAPRTDHTPLTDRALTTWGNSRSGCHRPWEPLPSDRNLGLRTR